MAVKENLEVSATLVAEMEEVLGVNNRSQLASAEAVVRDRIRERWLMEGVTMTDPDSVYIDADVSIGMDTFILPNTMLTGQTTVGENCEVGPNSVIRDSLIGNNCRVTSSALEEATMEDNTESDPSATCARAPTSRRASTSATTLRSRRAASRLARSWGISVTRATPPSAPG